MTVAELIECLRSLNQDAQVMIDDDYRAYFIKKDGVYVAKDADGIERCYIG